VAGVSAAGRIDVLAGELRRIPYTETNFAARRFIGGLPPTPEPYFVVGPLMLGPDVRRQVNVAYGYPPHGPSTLLPATFLRGGQSAPSPLRRLPSRTLASERPLPQRLSITSGLRCTAASNHGRFQSRTQQQRWVVRRGGELRTGTVGRRWSATHERSGGSRAGLIRGRKKPAATDGRGFCF
jgi:hypothetical protein